MTDVIQNAASVPVYLTDSSGVPYTAGGGSGGGGDASAANQTTQIARETSILAAAGAPADAAYAGSGNTTLVAVLKGIYSVLAASLGFLPAATDRSGSATTTSGGLTVAANANRRGLVGQNISAVNIGYNEFAGTAAIGTAGTFTVPPNASFVVSTNRAVNFIAASGTAAVSLTEY